MARKYCELCERNVEAKRKIGIGTLILAVITFGLWLLLIPFYGKRCPICQSADLSRMKSG